MSNPSTPLNYKPLPGTIAAKAITYLRTLTEPVFSVPTNVLLDAIGQPGLDGLPGYMQPALDAGLVTAERPKGSRQLHWRIGHGIPPKQATTDAAAATEADDDTRDLAGPPPTPDLSTASAFHLASAVQADADTAGQEPQADCTTDGAGQGRFSFRPGLDSTSPGASPQPQAKARQWPFARAKSTPQALEAPATASTRVNPDRAAKRQTHHAELPDHIGFLCALVSDGRLLIKSDGIELILPSEHAKQLRAYLGQWSFQPG